ncbi:MAG: putative oxidoreductase [Solirubrobacterales bacterium]|jgi:xylose dehydrogenase (NAD/NADP)|nr:putative oxidoreductase [Solirubrobacterales bacterium]
MTAVLRWGLLSTARINDALLGADPAKQERWVAVGSRSLERAQAYAAEKGLPRAHGSYEELLADPEVDAVYIGLPNGMHVEWTLKALEAGKHVLVEKPFSPHPDRVAACFDLAEARGLVLAEAFMWRHHPQALRARQLVEEGAIGELRALHAHFSFTLTDPADVRWETALEGGALMDLGCYCISGCRTLAGAEPERVSGELVRGGDGVDASFSAVLRFPGDVLATLTCSFDAVKHHELVATGTAGRLRLDDPWHGNRPVVQVTDGDGALTEHDCPSPLGSYALELDDLEAAAAGERPSRLGRADALGQARTLAALYASAASHEGVAP